MLLRIPGDIRAVFSREFSTLAGHVVFRSREDAGSMAAERAWRKLFFFRVIILYKPLKKLKRRTGAHGLVRERLKLWARREFLELWEPVRLHKGLIAARAPVFGPEDEKALAARTVHR